MRSWRLGSNENHFDILQWELLVPKNYAVLSAMTYFWLFFCTGNFFLLDRISADSFVFFWESNSECPGIRKDYGNISTGKVCLDSNEGAHGGWTNGPKKGRSFLNSCSLNYDKLSCYWVCLILFERFFFFLQLEEWKKKKKQLVFIFNGSLEKFLAWRTRQNCGCFPSFWCELSNRNRPETQKQISAWELSQNSHSNSAGGPLLLTFVHIRFCHFREKAKDFLGNFFSAIFFPYAYINYGL